ncbi:methyltransferase [Streptomyces sp. BH-SS-21]|uniref:Methyltransferase n=1 Tax=Streptomyces liliiviolaceus TaxID=2823109 RepID=A0A941B4H6_9ACTN|nr:HemK2/MTQ2 family protein methyltransferase [Streptomyces liliiviolaceus]MBQ0850375.1 methyltransferase [Streptomyces liliiviolaceus]
MPCTAVTRGLLPAGLLALPGVYRPQADTHLLATALAAEDIHAATKVLEIGTGTGALALSAARRKAQVTAVDVSRRAVATARLNALRHRLPLQILHGDFTHRTIGRRFDLVLANPPYVPSPNSSPPSSGPARAWDAGRDGRLVIDKICASAPALLHPGGILLIVHSVMSGPETTLKRLAEAGLTAEATTTASVPWGPILRSRRSWLQQQGLATNGEQQEKLVIIRARAH